MNREGNSLALLAVGILAGVVMGIFGTSAAAHHGWSGYEEKVVALSGSIVEASYSNPHGSMVLKTADAKLWQVVLAPPSRMQTRGLTKDMLVVGAKVDVEGYPHKTKPDELRAERIALAGKSIELR